MADLRCSPGRRLAEHDLLLISIATAGVIALMCLAVPPLELLPFAVVLPMGVIAAFGIALTVRDGLLMLIGFLGSGAALFVLITKVLFGMLMGGSSGGSGGMF